MPYVTAKQREHLDPLVDPILDYVKPGTTCTMGDINYLVTRIVDAWLGSSPRYHNYNAAIGVLECAKLELYAKRARPYEDAKEKENGTVYTPQED